MCYACGLRVSELVALQVMHIHGEQMYLQVVQGKGFKDRNIPLSDSLLQLLRDYWRSFRPVGGPLLMAVSTGQQETLGKYFKPKKTATIKDCRYTRGLPDRLGSEFSLQVYSPCVR